MKTQGTAKKRQILFILMMGIAVLLLATTDSAQTNSENPKMVLVEGGTFQMGSNDGEDDELPIHSVTVGAFYISKYEVTQAEWEDVMGENPSVFTGTNLPVEHITWYDAIEFCNKKSEKEGLTPTYTIDKDRIDPNNENKEYDRKWTVTVNWSANGYRLPTEAEWEFAARGGNVSKGYTYIGSSNNDEAAWNSENSEEKTHPVGTKKENELGIYDMSGNASEWCWDWYNEDYYDSSPSADPTGASTGTGRVYRGGSWNYDAGYCRAAFRNYGSAGRGHGVLGIRLVRTSNSEQ